MDPTIETTTNPESSNKTDVVGLAVTVITVLSVTKAIKLSVKMLQKRAVNRYKRTQRTSN